jgi:hypothetical protein
MNVMNHIHSHLRGTITLHKINEDSEALYSETESLLMPIDANYDFHFLVSH